jgi:hypothetical protein
MAAIGVAMAMSASAASAATLVDFTDTALFPDGSATPTIGGVGISLSRTGAAITQNLGDAPGPVGPLAGLSDGLGNGSDEISFGARTPQSITVTFSEAVRVASLYFLDLFQAANGSDVERAIATFSGGETVSTMALVTPNDGVGFAENSSFSPILATSVTFTAGFGNDQLGSPDFALAGLAFDVAPIPVPPSALFLGSSLLGFSVLMRQRRRKTV